MNASATKGFGIDDFARRRLDQRWTAKKNRTLVADYHRFVTHRRNIRAARGTRTHNNRDLRDSPG